MFRVFNGINKMKGLRNIRNQCVALSACNDHKKWMSKSVAEIARIYVYQMAINGNSMRLIWQIALNPCQPNFQSHQNHKYAVNH